MSIERESKTAEANEPGFIVSSFNLDEFSAESFDVEAERIDSYARLRHRWRGPISVRELKYIVRGNTMYVTSMQEEFAALNEHLLDLGIRDTLFDAGFIEVKQLANGQVRREIYGRSERFHVPQKRWKFFRRNTLALKLGRYFAIYYDWRNDLKTA